MNTNLFEIGYYGDSELKSLGFKSLGTNVRIAKNCLIVGIHNISIGNNVIIDSFCSIIASGEGYLNIGSYVHIASYCHLLASDGIELKDYSGLSQGVKIYSKTDDYSGLSLTNPTIPNAFKTMKIGRVELGEHTIIGAGGVILPNVTIGEGTSVGALSLVSSNLDSWTIYFGNPLKKLAKRSKKLLEKKQEFLDKIEVSSD
ncbi:acyltransferase [Winogradskyella psychrotolerans]|uniref:acyltransferase n=1 Tax=Winogradskyella psychrotolerans TaxID=1344585 RepID=UPI001C07549F|nr:acyltransferase [Winogradskyella psychrotolerans]MBU2929613.1 acyltransferase [Winogradskyella psychrotolerans]